MRGAIVMLGVGLLLPHAAHADEARDIAAYECIAAFGEASKSDDKQIAEQSLYGVYFFNGRLDPSLSEVQRLDRARRASAGITEENIGPIHRRCAAEIQRANDLHDQTVRAMQAVGEARE
jgi:hypothetical protein